MQFFMLLIKINSGIYETYSVKFPATRESVNTICMRLCPANCLKNYLIFAVEIIQKKILLFKRLHIFYLLNLQAFTE